MSTSKNLILYTITKPIFLPCLYLVDCIDISTPINMTKMGF